MFFTDLSLNGYLTPMSQKSEGLRAEHSSLPADWFNSVFSPLMLPLPAL